MVEVEFSIEASDETTAATKAANAKPRIPAGAKLRSSHG